MPDVLCNYVSKLKIEDYNSDLYLFSENFKPGKIRIDPRVISKKWDRIRDILKIPKEMQFYSLRDSGITQMIQDGISLEQIRD